MEFRRILCYRPLCRSLLVFEGRVRLNDLRQTSYWDVDFHSTSHNSSTRLPTKWIWNRFLISMIFRSYRYTSALAHRLPAEGRAHPVATSLFIGRCRKQPHDEALCFNPLRDFGIQHRNRKVSRRYSRRMAREPSSGNRGKDQLKGPFRLHLAKWSNNAIIFPRRLCACRCNIF